MSITFNTAAPEAQEGTTIQVTADFSNAANATDPSRWAVGETVRLYAWNVVSDKEPGTNIDIPDFVGYDGTRNSSNVPYWLGTVGDDRTATFDVTFAENDDGEGVTFEEVRFLAFDESGTFSYEYPGEVFTINEIPPALSISETEINEGENVTVSLDLSRATKSFDGSSYNEGDTVSVLAVGDGINPDDFDNDINPNIVQYQVQLDENLQASFDVNTSVNDDGGVSTSEEAEFYISNARDESGEPITSFLTINETVPPEFTVTYNGGNNTTINDGEEAVGVSITGTNLAPGEEYLFRVLVEDADGKCRPSDFATPNEGKAYITLTSENPTFTESAYEMPELEGVVSQEYKFYVERVEKLPELDPFTGNPTGEFTLRPTSEQFTGVGFGEDTPVSFTLIDNEYVAPAPAGGGGGGGSAPAPVVNPPLELGTLDADRLIFDDTDNLFNGLAGDDIIGGMGGNDQILGGGGSDAINGNWGDDLVHGNKGSDEVRGGKGNDIVRGGMGHDFLFGGQGDDQLYGGKGYDQLTGGEGADVFHLSPLDDVVTDFQVGIDSINTELVGSVDWKLTDEGLLGTYDTGSTLFAGVDTMIF